MLPWTEQDLETILAQVHDLLPVVGLHVVNDPHVALLEDEVASHIDGVGEDDLGILLGEVLLLVVSLGPLDRKPESEPSFAMPRRSVMAKDDDAALVHEVGLGREVVELVLLICALNFSSPRALLAQVDDLVQGHDSQRVWWLARGKHHR